MNDIAFLLSNIEVTKSELLEEQDDGDRKRLEVMYCETLRDLTKALKGNEEKIYYEAFAETLRWWSEDYLNNRYPIWSNGVLYTRRR